MPRPFQVMLMESDSTRFISTGSAESVGHYARSIGGQYMPGEGFAFTNSGEIIWNNASAENAARIVSHELVHQFDAGLGRVAGSQGFLSENGTWLEAVRRDYELSQQNQGNRVAMYDDEGRTVFDRIMSETDMRIRAREALAEMGSHHMIMRASGLSDVEIDAKMRWTYPNMWESYEKNFLPYTEQHAAQLLERRNAITEGYVKSEHALAEAKGLPWGPEQEGVARARAAEIPTSRMESTRIYNWQQADIASGTVPLASSEVDRTTPDLPKPEAQRWGKATEGSQPAAATPDTAPRPALSAEPAGWLARDLTWGEATQDHLRHWFKEANYNAWHDPSHVVLALSGMPKFQATFDAEIHALTIDDALARPNPESNFDPSVLATEEGYRASPEFRDSPAGIEERNISRHPVTGKLTYTPSAGEHIDDSARRAQIFVNDSGKQVIVDHSYGRSVVAPVAALDTATPDSRAPAADASPVDAVRTVSTPELPRATTVEMSATELDAAREAAAGDKLLGRAGTKLPPGAIRMQNLMRQAAQNGAAAGASPNTETPSSTPDAAPNTSPSIAPADIAHTSPVAPPTAATAPAPVATTTPSSGNTAQTSTPSTTTVAVEAAVAAKIVTSAQADSVTPPLTEPTHSKAMNKGMSGLGLGMATNMVKEINRKLEAGETVSVEEYVAAGVNMGSGALDLAGKGLDSLAGAKMGTIKGGALVQTALALPMILAAARTGDSTQIGAVSAGTVSGIGFGLAGQTFIPIPGVGFVIGVVAGEAGAKLGGLATTAMLNDDPVMRAQAQNELKNLAIEYGTPPGVGLNLAGAAVSSVGRAVNTLGQVSTWLGDKVDDLNALTGRNLVTGPVLGGASLVLKGTGAVVSGLGNAVDAVGQASEAVGHGVNRATKEMIRGVGSAVNHFGQSLTQEYQRDPTVRGALKATVVATADVVQRTVDYAERRLQESGQAVVDTVSNAQSWYANNAPSWLGGKGEKTPEKHPTPHPSYTAQITSLIAEAKAKGRAGELDANHDGKYDISDIKANLKKTGMKLDNNGDGTITGGEFIRAQTTPAKPAQLAAAQAHR